MTASAPFTGLYSKAMRALLPCLTGQETKLFVAVATYTDDQGKCWPGVRELSDVTVLPPDVVSHLLVDLEAKGLVLTLRRSQRDPLTGRMVPDVYIVNPEIVMVSDLSLWMEIRLRHVSIPESGFPVNSAQADRITEAESENQNQQSRITAFEGAAMLFPDPMATRNHTTANTGRQNGETNSTAGSANAQNAGRQPNTPPGSGAPPVRPLTFSESAAVSGVKRHVPDMGHEVAADLIVRYGVEQFTAAVMSYKKRSEKVTIKRPTGWIIQNLKMGEKR